MARVNPLVLPRPTRQVVHALAGSGDNVADLWFRALDTTEQFQALELANGKIKLYITGDDKKPALDFPPVGGAAVEGLSEALLQAVASICLMQSDVDENGHPVPDAPYTFEELVAMSITLPGVWSDMMQLGSDVTKLNSEQSKNALGAGTASISTSPSGTAKATRK